MTSPPLQAAASHRARALKLERAGDLPGALDAYQAAVALTPEDPELLASLALIAERMALHEIAERLWARLPGLAAVDGRARALRELGRFDEAVEILKQALLAHPEAAPLWNTLGVTLVQQGAPELSITFFDEALRLDPGHARALYNRGGAWFDLARLDAADADFTAARKLARRPLEAATIDFAAATLALSRGELAAGWDAYEVRLSRDWPGSAAFEGSGKRWTPGARIAGRRLLVLAEQGLGDELMFANVLPDVQAALGREGRLAAAVDPRLVELFRRSFPDVEVTAHATARDGLRPRRTAPEAGAADLWTPMGSLCREFRRSPEAFPSTTGYLKPDPARVAHWRAWLGAGPPAVGVTWRSGKLLGDRRRHYPPVEAWTPLLAVPGVRFVNLQYGDCGPELEALGRLAGRPLLQAPGLDLREAIDDLAALTVALDLTVAVANATGALAGACGASLALIGAPWAWPRLGTDRYPWYPQAAALAPPALGDWAPVMAEAAERVGRLARS